jgi:hypothetical protein
VAITGTHCAGKATIGRRVAEALGWKFDPELGEILRENVIPGHHKAGYDGHPPVLSWDEMIFNEEQRRDRSNASNGASRVVETWHVGNLSWALFRRRIAGTALGPQGDEALIRQYFGAVREHGLVSLVLLVHLSTEDGVSVRRRRAVASNSQRLPLECQVEDCRELRDALEERGLELLSRLENYQHFPVLIVDNSKDGESAQLRVARSIVEFVNEHVSRACLRDSATRFNSSDES